MSRPGAPPNYALDAAVDASTLSPCRSKRGVAIFRDGQIVGAGFNDQVAPFQCNGTAACKVICRDMAVHAEQFALLQAGKAAAGCELVHVKTVDGLLAKSGGPSCIQCSKLIVPAGIVGVWLYLEIGWHRYDAQEFHRLSVNAHYGLPESTPGDQPNGTSGGALTGDGSRTT